MSEENKTKKDPNFDGFVLDSKPPKKIKQLSEVVLILLARGRKEDIRQATEKIVEKILSDRKIYTIRDDIKTEIWIYIGGIYVPRGISYVKEFIRGMLGEAYTPQLANEVIAKISVDTYIDADKFFKEGDINKIAIKNGILDLKTKKLEMFSEEFFFFNKLPVEYKPKQDCPNIKKHFEEVLPHKEDILVMQEWFGYLLLRDQPMEKSCMLCGTGRNGKGKTLSLMKSFLGIENVANIPLQRFDQDKFSIIELHNKLVNLGGDISKTALRETGMFKQLTGRDLITAPRKFMSGLSFTNYAKLIFCANELPITYDLTIAFFNRWIIMDFPFTFLKKNEIDILDITEKKMVKLADLEIIEKITTEGELSGLLNWSLEGLGRLREQKDFSYSKTTDQTKKMWLRRSSSIYAFCMDELEVSYDSKITKIEFRQSYNRYCREFKTVAASDKIIKKVLAEMYGVVDDRDTFEGKQEYCWVGIRFNSSNKISEGSEGCYGIPAHSEKQDLGIGAKRVANLATLTKNHTIAGFSQDSQGISESSPVEMEDLVEPYHVKCAVDEKNPCHYSYKGKYFCSKECVESFKINK